MITFDHSVCSDLDNALTREWLETNGVGGFSSSTIVGLNTRRYHGLLVAATRPPVGRMVLLSKLEETLCVGDLRFDLSANQYPGIVHPRGFQYLQQFRLDPFPVFTYRVAGIEIVKSIFMIQGENSTAIHYRIGIIEQATSAERICLEIRPLIAFRDYHGTTHENPAIHAEIDRQTELASMTPYAGLPTLHLAHNATEIQTTGDWHRNFIYEAERERGLDFQEDLFNPLLLEFDLRLQPEPSIIASTEPRNIASLDAYRRLEIARRREARNACAVSLDLVQDGFVQALSEASDQFIVSRGEDKSVIAGYHWFSDWGRDTMISLPGLTLPSGRFDVARGILRNFGRYVSQGMLPNRFPDAGETPEYNTVDATLWFFEAVRQFLAYTGELDFVRDEMYPLFRDIIAWHIRGTRYGIGVGAGGLLESGQAGVQLTWMDAKAGDWVVTPRCGKPVEIQALWYNALSIMQELAGRFGDNQDRYRELADLASETFNSIFWNDREECLYDVILDDRRDASIRPNQIFAVSLPHGMLSPLRAKAVVDKVQKELLTPYGLRTLSANDPHYRGRYLGDQLQRDGAYHQGTVWPWLLGPFINAYLKVNGDTELSRGQALEWLNPLRDHLNQAGLQQISEIFDGDAPHCPRGCIAQAWSVAEILRTLIENVHGKRPEADRLPVVSGAGRNQHLE